MLKVIINAFGAGGEYRSGLLPIAVYLPLRFQIIIAAMPDCYYCRIIAASIAFPLFRWLVGVRRPIQVRQAMPYGL